MNLFSVQTLFCFVVSVWRGFLFLWVLGMGYVILLRHSLSLPYNYFGQQLLSDCSMITCCVLRSISSSTEVNVVFS